MGEQELGEKLFHEIIEHPIPLDMNTLRSLKRSPLGLDLYLWLTYRTFNLTRPLRLTWRQLYRQFGADPSRPADRALGAHQPERPRGPRRVNGCAVLPHKRASDWHNPQQVGSMLQTSALAPDDDPNPT